MAAKKGLLERLSEGPVIGDGGFCFSLEKRGYVRAGVWLPQCTVLHPDAVRQLHCDILRAGADVMQSFNFLSGESWLQSREERKLPPGKEINLAAYKLAREVADRGDALVSVSLTQTLAYCKSHDKTAVQQEYRDQLAFFKEEGCEFDFVICEYFSFIEEMEWAIEAAKEAGVPVVATMCIGPHGEKEGTTTGQCAVRMTKAGADVVGANCKFGPLITLSTMKEMKQALDESGLSPYLICQGFFTPEIQEQDGYLNLPEHYLAYEPRVCTRFEMQNFAREAYNLGVRYIGGCCGVEPYHIRAISEELSAERQKVAPITQEFGDILSGVREHPLVDIPSSADPEYWKYMQPGTGRPRSSAFSPIQLSITIAAKEKNNACFIRRAQWQFVF